MAMRFSKWATVERWSTHRVPSCPAFQSGFAFAENAEDENLILFRRVAGPLLPTLVASYRNQFDLPLKNLREKGLLTWLVTEARESYVPRFLDVAEAQRLMGLASHALAWMQWPLCKELWYFSGCLDGKISNLFVLLFFTGCRQPPLNVITRSHTLGFESRGCWSAEPPHWPKQRSGCLVARATTVPSSACMGKLQ